MGIRSLQKQAIHFMKGSGHLLILGIRTWQDCFFLHQRIWSCQITYFCWLSGLGRTELLNILVQWHLPSAAKPVGLLVIRTWKVHVISFLWGREFAGSVWLTYSFLGLGLDGSRAHILWDQEGQNHSICSFIWHLRVRWIWTLWRLVTKNSLTRYH